MVAAIESAEAARLQHMRLSLSALAASVVASAAGLPGFSSPPNQFESGARGALPHATVCTCQFVFFRAFACERFVLMLSAVAQVFLCAAASRQSRRHPTRHRTGRRTSIGTRCCLTETAQGCCALPPVAV